jgi:hypothetical protein
VKNYFLALVLALLVVLSSVSIRRSVLGIGTAPAPIPPMSGVGIGTAPAPIPPMSAVGIGTAPETLPAIQ